MRKDFKSVTDFARKKLKETVVVLAGIAFTLFGTSFDEAASHDSTAIPEVELTESADLTEPTAGEATTTSEKIDVAYRRLQADIKEEPAYFDNVISEIKRNLDTVDAVAVSVDGYVPSREINVAFLLKDQVILSVNTRLDEVGAFDGLVAYHIIDGDDLLVSNIATLAELRDTLNKVQSSQVWIDA